LLLPACNPNYIHHHDPSRRSCAGRNQLGERLVFGLGDVLRQRRSAVRLRAGLGKLLLMSVRRDGLEARALAWIGGNERRVLVLEIDRGSGQARTGTSVGHASHATDVRLLLLLELADPLAFVLAARVAKDKAVVSPADARCKSAQSSLDERQRGGGGAGRT